jgi:hypothetical protein
MAATRAATTASQIPKISDHSTFPKVSVEPGVDVGELCNAASAFRATDRDFLYSAGFHIGRPNGCSMLIAYMMIMMM